MQIADLIWLYCISECSFITSHNQVNQIKWTARCVSLSIRQCIEKICFLIRHISHWIAVDLPEVKVHEYLQQVNFYWILRKKTFLSTPKRPKRKMDFISLKLLWKLFICFCTPWLATNENFCLLYKVKKKSCAGESFCDDRPLLCWALSFTVRIFIFSNTFQPTEKQIIKLSITSLAQINSINF